LLNRSKKFRHPRYFNRKPASTKQHKNFAILQVSFDFTALSSVAHTHWKSMYGQQMVVLMVVYIRGDEPICYRGPLCQLPLSNRAVKLFSHTMKPVSSRLLVLPECESSRLLVSPECFAGRTKFFCRPHVRHPWFTSTTKTKG